MNAYRHIIRELNKENHHLSHFQKSCFDFGVPIYDEKGNLRKIQDLLEDLNKQLVKEK